MPLPADDHGGATGRTARRRGRAGELAEGLEVFRDGYVLPGETDAAVLELLRQLVRVADDCA